MKFEVGERVQAVDDGELKIGIIEEVYNGMAKIATDKDYTYKYIFEIAKLEQPKPVEVKKPLFEHLESYHDLRVMPLLKVAKDFINSDFWDDYCDLKNDGEDWSLAIAKAMENGYVVEEEQKYYVKLPEPFGYLRRSKIYPTTYDVRDASKYTKKEIERLDERYWAFAVPVEEVEASAIQK